MKVRLAPRALSEAMRFEDVGGDAALRRGEMLALRWADVDFKRRQLQVQEAVWERKRRDGKGHECITDTPKGGRSRVVPLTDALLHAPIHIVTCAASTCSSVTTGIPRRASSCADSSRRLESAQQRGEGARTFGPILGETGRRRPPILQLPAFIRKDSSGREDSNPYKRPFLTMRCRSRFHCRGSNPHRNQGISESPSVSTSLLEST